ncbi:MAG: putative metal-dependent hydrolase [Gemmatales bacterium]
MPERPENPVGPFVSIPKPTPVERAAMISTIKQFPAKLKQAVAGLTLEQLQTKYRNWTLQQIVNHMADSHCNAYVRFKLTLTEKQPTIKPYDETGWSALEESKTTDINISLQMLEAIHHRWGRVMDLMKDEDFARTYYHPEYKTVVSLDEALGVYSWHCKHHLAQVEMVCRELVG